MRSAFVEAALRLALMTCPREFRDEYGDDIRADIDDAEQSGLRFLATLVNVFWSGLALRAETLARDVSFAWRTLSKAPIFVAVSIAAIALAVAVNVAVGSIVEHLLINPLPYAQQGRLVYVFSTIKGARQDALDYPDLIDLARRNRTLVALSGATGTSGTLTRRGTPILLQGREVAPRYFDVLAIRPQLGRVFAAGDRGQRAIVISDELWRKRYSADPHVVGATADIDGVAYRIIGVAPPETADPSPSGFLQYGDYWIAADPHGERERSRGWYAYNVIGRLKDDEAIDAANADLQAIATDLAKQFPGADASRNVEVVKLGAAMLGAVYQVLLVIQASVFVVFLIAAANVAGLAIVRAGAREQEMLTRISIGATRRRIAAQLIVETALLACGGSASGVVLGLVALGWIRNTVVLAMPGGTEMPGWKHLGLDAPLVGYIIILALVFTLSVGLLPALASRRRQRGAGRLRRVLVAAQMTLAFVLVMIAGLLLRSFVAMERADIGIDGTNLSWISVGSLLGSRYSSDGAGREFVEKFGDRLRAIPGVISAAESGTAPFGDEEYTGYRLDGEPSAVRGRWANVDVVTPGYFQTLKVPLLRGRDFNVSDRDHSQPVAIVSRRFALRAFGTIDAVGRNVAIGMSAGGNIAPRRIVGVVGDVRHRFSRPPAVEIYAPLGQIALIGGFAVRAAKPMPQLAQSVAITARQFDAGLPPPTVQTFDTLRSFDALPNYMTTIILMAVAAIALVLALSGVYGVVATSVARRTREFGIRAALGAPPRSIAVAAAGEAVTLAAISIAIGLVVSAFCTRMLAEVLFETSPFDVGTFAAVTGLIIASSIAACIGPSRMAARSDPAKALRYE